MLFELEIRSELKFFFGNYKDLYYFLIILLNSSYPWALKSVLLRVGFDAINTNEGNLIFTSRLDFCLLYKFSCIINLLKKSPDKNWQNLLLTYVKEDRQNPLAKNEK